MTTEERGKGRRVLVECIGACLHLSQTSAWGGPKKPAEDCITPTGVDLNERYGVPETIIAPLCATLNAGRYWTVNDGWFMSPTFVAVPAGFAPEGATPLEDHIAKFIGVKYVIDPGTHQEKTLSDHGPKHAPGEARNGAPGLLPGAVSIRALPRGTASPAPGRRGSGSIASRSEQKTLSFY
jgi:hypothetical protein